MEILGREDPAKILKPCPFCGGESFVGKTDGLFYAECEECHICTALYYEEKRAINTWNRRAKDGN